MKDISIKRKNQCKQILLDFCPENCFVEWVLKSPIMLNVSQRMIDWIKERETSVTLFNVTFCSFSFIDIERNKKISVLLKSDMTRNLLRIVNITRFSYHFFRIKVF
jgi:hypothetical protein